MASVMELLMKKLVLCVGLTQPGAAMKGMRTSRVSISAWILMFPKKSRYRVTAESIDGTVRKGKR